MRFLRTRSLLGFAMVAGLSAAVHANTIQPIFMSATDNGNGTFTYQYDLQITPNNGLSSNVTYQSAVIIFDFGHIVGTPVLSNLGGLVGANVTSATDWAVEVVSTGAGSLANAGYSPTYTTLSGASKSLKADDLEADNVVVSYINPVELQPVTALQRSLVQLTLVSDLAPGGSFLDSLSRNTIVGRIDELGTHSVSTGEPSGGTIPVPAPAAVWAGFSLMGSLGVFGAVRRRRLQA
jgi:hypothetical protein